MLSVMTDKPTGYLIAAGDPFDGLVLYGDEAGQPWIDAGLAVEYASEAFRGETWWVTPLYAVSQDSPPSRREMDAFDEDENMDKDED